MKGLSGAVTALILVIASVIIALIVVGFAFGLFGTLSSQNAITNAGAAYITKTGNTVTIYVTLNNPGPSTPVITSVSVNGIPVNINYVVANYNTASTSANNLNSVTISTGQVYLTLNGNLATQLNVQPGATVTIQISFSNGQVITVPATLNVA